MAASELRLPPFFPASPAPCKAEADAFFTAFTAASAYAGDKVRPLSARAHSAWALHPILLAAQLPYRQATTHAAYLATPTSLPSHPDAQERAGVGREALGALAPELQSYSACVRKHLSKKELARAPEHYTQQLPPK